MKKFITISIISTLLTAGMAFGAKYKVNSSGTVKTNGSVVNQNLYNVYSTQNYNAGANTSQVQIIDLVMDYSGSMANWIIQAKRTMSYVISQIPDTTKVGLRVFGQADYNSQKAQQGTVHEIKKVNGKYKAVTTTANPSTGTNTGACSATSQLVALTQANSTALINGMNSARIGGSTPMVYGLDRAAAEDLTQDRTTPKKIILITDGGENCGGDPCAFAKQLMQTRSDIHIDVILVDSGSNKLSCLATTTGGHMYKVNDLSKFSTVLTQSMQSHPVQTSQPQQEQQEQQYEFYKD
ncbi:VWA domain-containing protein [bacterium]|nr:VWA domain-containing protein [bacterium]